MAELLKVVLTAESGKSVKATIVGVYARNEIAPTDAPTMRNMACSIFAGVPQAERIALVCTERTALLFLFEAAHRWFDTTGAPVVIRKVAEAAA